MPPGLSEGRTNLDPSEEIGCRLTLASTMGADGSANIEGDIGGRA